MELIIANCKSHIVDWILFVKYLFSFIRLHCLDFKMLLVKTQKKKITNSKYFNVKNIHWNPMRWRRNILKKGRPKKNW